MQAVPTEVEISVKGKWQTVPALAIDEKKIIVKGKALRIAQVEAEDWLETELEDPQACVDALKRTRGFHADILSFAQKLPAIEPRYRYPMEWDSVAAVSLTTFEQWWQGLPQETRKNVRRAEKRGVAVEVRPVDDRLIEDLCELNQDSPIRQGKAFTHYGKTLEQVRKDQQAFLDRSDYICAYHADQLIGVVKLVYRGGIASILTFLSRGSASDMRPANAMMAKAVEVCVGKGISHLIFGKFNYGNKRNTSLREFKTRHGFEEVLVPRYYVPLTAKGAICTRLKLHRGLIGILPHEIIVFLVNTRAKLYALTRAGVAQW
jgi:hypothetical protein